MKESQLSKHVWNLKDMFLIKIFHKKSTKKASPYPCGPKRCGLCLPQKSFPYLCWSKHFNKYKEPKLFRFVAAEIKFCLPTLTNNCRCMVFHDLPNYFIKTQNKMTYFVLQFFDKTCDRTLLTISIINFHGVKFY